MLPTPANLVRWKIANEDICRCGKRGTLKHILSNCAKALDRYTWRHNEVLKIIHRVTKDQIERITSGKRLEKPTRNQGISFVRSGQVSFYKQNHSTTNDTSWDGNWEIAADLAECQRFFPIPTPKKPDIVVWCPERKIVHLVELTVPHEDNIEAVNIRKNDGYDKLIENARKQAGKPCIFLLRLAAEALSVQGCSNGSIRLASTIANEAQ